MKISLLFVVIVVAIAVVVVEARVVLDEEHTSSLSSSRNNPALVGGVQEDINEIDKLIKDAASEEKGGDLAVSKHDADRAEKQVHAALAQVQGEMATANAAEKQHLHDLESKLQNDLHATDSIMHELNELGGGDDGGGHSHDHSGHHVANSKLSHSAVSVQIINKNNIQTHAAPAAPSAAAAKSQQKMNAKDKEVATERKAEAAAHVAENDVKVAAAKISDVQKQAAAVPSTNPDALEQAKMKTADVAKQLADEESTLKEQLATADDKTRPMLEAALANTEHEKAAADTATECFGAQKNLADHADDAVAHVEGANLSFQNLHKQEEDLKHEEDLLDKEVATRGASMTAVELEQREKVLDEKVAHLNADESAFFKQLEDLKHSVKLLKDEQTFVMALCKPPPQSNANVDKAEVDLTHLIERYNELTQATAALLKHKEEVKTHLHAVEHAVVEDTKRKQEESDALKVAAIEQAKEEAILPTNEPSLPGKRHHDNGHHEKSNERAGGATAVDLTSSSSSESSEADLLKELEGGTTDHHSSSSSSQTSKKKKMMMMM